MTATRELMTKAAAEGSVEVSHARLRIARPLWLRALLVASRPDRFGKRWAILTPAGYETLNSKEN